MGPRPLLLQWIRERSMTMAPVRPLETALDTELRRIELFIAYTWLVLCAIGTVGALVVAATISPRLGLTLAPICAITAVFFLAAARWVGRRPVAKRTPLVIVSVEAMLPWAYFAALFFAQGAAYALSSWIPPLLFASLVVSWVARLQPTPPLVVSIVGALAYLVVYFVFVRPEVPQGAAHLILHDPPMQLSRALSLVIAGGAGTLVAREVRRAIVRADVAVRSEELFGKYRLVRKIGSGSGGSVHEAMYCPEGGFERRVAIKQLHPGLVSEPNFVQGFRTEAELGARLAHPNIVTIHDFGRHEATFFMAMEFVDGLPLSRLAVRARAANLTFASDIVAHIARSVLQGLAYAHEGIHDASGNTLHILHRDVCPQNLLVSRMGEVKLTDFGIARVLMQPSESANTRTIAGHEAYMAPEQVEGRQLLVSDLFAVGVVLWELLAGKRLFARDNPAVTLLAVMSAPIPPMSSVRSDAEVWDAFLERALARETDKRFASAREMLAALDAIPSARGGDAAGKLAALVVELSSAQQATPPDVSSEVDVQDTVAFARQPTDPT
jgi:eukaryotic-like serine/threonine-protein kinase